MGPERGGYGSSPGTPEEKFAKFVELVKAANRIGAINTISAHMNNFVTAGNHGDTTGDVVSRIMPGGDRNAASTAYLDRVARFAHAATDDQGRPIPMIFRPFHENSGSWFWWGAAHASSAQYVELFRYPVEYLRDTKDVHNFLYAYSPGGSYGGTDDVYTRTYPGDDYVDVLGYDNYDGVGLLDLLDPFSIDTFATRYLDSGRPLPILINNAGFPASAEIVRDARGYEAQFAANHLGHFQLTLGLLPALRAARGARVVTTTSGAQRFSDIRWDDPHFTSGGYDPGLAYAQS